MTEEKFYEIIKQKTNWDVKNLPIDKSFGFVIGVCHPFLSIGAVSSSYMPNFLVWKREGSKEYSHKIECSNPEKMLEEVIEFLNKDFN